MGLERPRFAATRAGFSLAEMVVVVLILELGLLV
ncbi:MAG: prepilin-type N-terminal cleavage/methylation domain-containing protein, partial [Gemmatimonadetes bacterium]|nr:prepilin-type N-terminal cleavage/methylation domain-containing protein [Gemmatimonadota bacterium]NIQ57348.1 prepilin-type N-terminal cleavage/methylation domain-containing protein [Gemmatimonadota bacterium]NIU77511.1 prepilin-type N-terminal cleavage/methylation domain-containing protein [Gammaproteobacteria bacterium]NIX46719.1 prepilin-type N-terminal cleavage/methylation domain-containing protein [Gemmatimonadota bacterium]NIY11067.1 prepilin-type N-terminal cleavage/methylation domain